MVINCKLLTHDSAIRPTSCENEGRRLAVEDDDAVCGAGTEREEEEEVGGEEAEGREVFSKEKAHILSMIFGRSEYRS